MAVWFDADLKDLVSEHGSNISAFLEFTAIKELMRREVLPATTVKQWRSESRMRDSTIGRLEGEKLI